MRIEKIRQDIPIVKHYTFLDHANMSPSPIQVLDTVHKVMEEKTKFAHLNWENWMKQIDETRESVAKLIGAKKKEEIWFMNTTSEGLNIAANMIDWQQEDNVVISDLEFPSNIYPWLKKKKKGVEIRFVKTLYKSNGALKVDINEFDKMIDDRTRVVAVSSVDFGFGYRFDLKEISEIAHDHGALVIVDAIQSVGAIQTHANRDNADIIAFGGQKWTLAPSAGGGFYIRADLIDKFEPPILGWMSVRDSSEQFKDEKYKSRYDLAGDARRFAPGHPNFLCIIGFGTSAKYLLDIGITRIEKRILNLTKRLMIKLDSLGYRIITPREDVRRAGIVSFEFKNPGKKIETLKSKNIIVSGENQTRGKGIRVSPHFYNTEDEIDKFVEEMRACK